MITNIISNVRYLFSYHQGQLTFLFYIAPSLRSIWSFCRFNFFWETFFFSGSAAAAAGFLANAWKNESHVLQKIFICWSIIITQTCVCDCQLSSYLFLFNKANFNVTWWRHVWINTTMGTVCSASHFGCTVHLNMIDHEVVSIKALVLSIWFCIFQQVK